MIRMNPACKDALAEWDAKLEENQSRQFLTCTGELNSVTAIAFWRSTDTEQKLMLLELRSNRGNIRDL